MFGRRRFLKMLGIGAAVAPVAAVLSAQTTPKLIPFKFSTTDVFQMRLLPGGITYVDTEYNDLLGNSPKILRG